MKIDFSIEEAVQKRYSVRNYQKQEVDTNLKHEIEAFVGSLENPFGKKVNFHFLESKEAQNQQKLGTYGVITGAEQYIGTTIQLEPMSLEALGYEMEAVILYLAHLGLGTCWLGGTFNRKGFANAMNIGENDIFPIVTPYGYPAPKKQIKETMMRKMIQADQRKEWSSLFFKSDFQTPLSKEEANELAFALEMVRLGPSASNKQPWRIVVTEQGCHFYEYKEPNYSDRFAYDIQRIDMGIAAAHFDFAVKEKMMQGAFHTESEPDITLPENVEYAFSWIKE